MKSRCARQYARTTHDMCHRLSLRAWSRYGAGSHRAIELIHGAHAACCSYSRRWAVNTLTPRVMNKDREANLKPIRDSARARRLQQMGVEARRRNKRGRELTRLILELPVLDDDIRAELESAGIEPEQVINEAVADWAMLRRASAGDAQAYEKLMKKAGYMTEQHDVKMAERVVVNFGE